MVRMDATADDSLAAMRARSKFGIAIAAMIRMIATTISNSISENPFCLRISNFSPSIFVRRIYLLSNDAVVSTIALACPNQRLEEKRWKYLISNMDPQFGTRVTDRLRRKIASLAK